MRRPTLALAALILALGSGAAADQTEGASMGSVPGTGAAPTHRTLRAETSPLSRLGLFAEGRGFTLLRQGTLFDLEGGASFRLLEGLALVGSYRLLGYDYDIGATTVDPQVSGAFFGLKLGF